MADITVRLPADSTGQALGMYRPGAAATDQAFQYIVPTSDRIISSLFDVSTFRTVGNAAATQTLVTVENSTGSAVLVGIRDLNFTFFASAAYTGLPPQLFVSRTTAIPSGGTQLTKARRDTVDASSASLIIRGGVTADAGTVTAITATAAAEKFSQVFIPSYFTLVGQSQSQAQWDLLPRDFHFDPLILRAGEAIGVFMTAVTPASSNPATNHYIVTVHGEEFTRP